MYKEYLNNAESLSDAEIGLFQQPEQSYGLVISIFVKMKYRGGKNYGD